MASIRDKYNRFLDSNPALNAFGSIQDEVKRHRKGHIIQLVGALTFGGFLSLFLSLLASIMGYGNTGATTAYTLLASAINMVVSNIIFGLFLLRVREESFSFEIVRRYFKLIVVQLLCGVVLAVAQTFALNFALTLTAFDARLNTLTSIFVSVVFTLFNALVAFRVLDGTHRVRDIMPGMFSVIGRHWVPLVFLGMLFLVWSFAANVMYASLLYDQITAVQSINNVFHALLNQHEFALAGQVCLFYLVNFVVGGFFECGLLLGLAVCYEREKDSCF